jgi:multicomponent Na+:H+ antiporter subunit E
LRKRIPSLSITDVLVFGLLLTLWFFLTGSIDVGRIIVGLLLATGITLFWRLTMRPATAGSPVIAGRRLLFLFLFFARLHWDVLLSNIYMVGFLWRPRLAIKPQLVTIDLRLRSPGLQVLLANAITMTPGTLSVQLKDNRILIHCVDESLAVGLAECALVRLLERAEGIDA